MRSSLPLVSPVVTAILLAVPCSQSGLAQEDFTPMFNGKDFSGWIRTNTPEETWSYKDGVVVCTGKPIGEIRTSKMYQNFVMELQWRHLVPRGNAGVFIWADDITSRGVPFHRGIEVQILENAYGNNRSHTTHGDIFPIHGAKMTPINGHGGSRAFPTEERSKPSPEWNHYRIEGRDGEISLAVNGKVVTRGKNCIPSKGYICLESEGGIVEYRNVRIMELPATDIDASHVAIADRGYQSIYNGLDLSEWVPSSEQSSWKSKDWILSFAGSQNESSLRSASEYSGANFVFDVRLTTPSSTAMIALGERKIDLSDPAVAVHLVPSGKWNRFEGIKRGADFEFTVNGNTLPADSGAPLEGHITLKPSGPVDFANIYVGPRSQLK